VDASSFGCAIILSLYLMLNFVISSLVVGSFKPVRKILLVVCHGGLLFWYLCNIAMFELLAVPHRGIPYVQMGFRIVQDYSK
jgi:hypothetical protein